MKKYIFGALAVYEMLLMFYNLGLAETEQISLSAFVWRFVIEAAALVLCLWQAGAFDMPEEKEKP